MVYETAVVTAIFSVSCSKDGVWRHVSCSFGPLNQPKPLRDFGVVEAVGLVGVA